MIEFVELFFDQGDELDDMKLIVDMFCIVFKIVVEKDLICIVFIVCVFQIVVEVICGLVELLKELIFVD